jgi:hypothetical protein
MNSHRDSGLLWLVVLGGLLFYGPALAIKLRHSLIQIGTTLAPLALPVLGVIAVTLLVRMYWQRY